jgi:hypothetical protein
MEELEMFRTVAIVVLVVAPMHAASAASCMTKSEARQAYSTSYLYWHGADHCWDATPNGRRDIAGQRHHFVLPHRDEDQVAQAQPQPQPALRAQLQPAIQAQSQPEEPAPLPLPILTSADLIRAGHTMRIEELESTLRDRWPDTNMEFQNIEFQTKPVLIASAAADAEPIVPVRIVMLSIGVILVICTVLEVAFGARIAQRRIDRYM